MDATARRSRSDVSNETLSKSTLDSWQVLAERINLERALKAGDELGGHIVSGHVDGVARIVDLKTDGESLRVLLELPQHLAPYAAPKGSIALDGTSLTVNEVSGNRFGVNLIPVTLTQTTWGRKSRGDEVNVEIDLFARYVARMMEFRAVTTQGLGKIAYSEGERLSVVDGRDRRGHAQWPHGHPRRRGGPRERGRSRHPRADGDARRRSTSWPSTAAA